MAESVRDKKLIYHLTALENLASIAANGLLSRREVQRRRLTFKDVADAAILEGRGDHDLDAMVPFHFFPRNPFDYAVVRQRKDERFVLLAVQRTRAKSDGWRVVPRHPLSGPPSLLAWDEGMDAIDWAQIDRPDRDYKNHECKMVCMAEALSPATVQCASMSMIFVATDEDESSVNKLLKNVSWSPRVKVNRGMFP